eukprot:TRINITY_DN3514_c0_g1_i3.p1 TRINITY_DN3514_c0_g1~~TRINITY_DN3514_c0_g1_i3.p1  ORF type:complete len:680 (+),score=219.69 TRINITY_DN3514_c0_g1_i3:59-2041(+)
MTQPKSAPSEGQNNLPDNYEYEDSVIIPGGESLDYDEHTAAELSINSRNNMWYKEAVFYEVYVRAFCDLQGTGHGNLAGLTSKLDYLHALGVDCVWLLPIYPSPLKDDGYDVADYCNIHQDYGRLEDFKTLVAAVHERNMKIIADMIPNHCSNAHMWFQEARKSRDNPYRDYFVWSDSIEKYKEARIIFCDVEPSNWTWDEQAGQYYWHRFFAEQPDLNFDNPQLQDEMIGVLKFWMDLGIDGFRVDAVPYLFERENTSCENLPETHHFLKRMRKFIDDNYPGCILLAEACQMPEEVREYFGDGDEFHMGFHFPVMPRIYMGIKREDSTCIKDIMAQTPAIPPNCQWVTFLRNHDELTLEMVTPEERKWMWEQYAPEPRMKINMGIRRRLAPLMDNDRRRIDLAYSLLFTMPGSPIIYYGDEIGMGDNIWLNDRHGVRTPMQWDGTPNGGFTLGTNPLYSPMINDELFGYERVNVEANLKDPSSLFHCIRMMINRRRKHISFGHGSFQWVHASTTKLACFIRAFGIDRMLAVHNLSKDRLSASVYLPSNEYRLNESAGYVFGKEGNDMAAPKVIDVLTNAVFNVSGKGSIELTLEPYQFLWLNLGELGGMGESGQKPQPKRRASVVAPPSGMGAGLAGKTHTEAENVGNNMGTIAEEPEK